MCFSMVSVLDDDVGVPGIADREDLAQLVVHRRRILRDVRFERDARALEEDHLAGAVVRGGVAVVGVVEFAEVGGDAHRVAAGFDVGQHARIPHALFAFAVRSVVIEVPELAHEGALADAGAADDRDLHRPPAGRCSRKYFAILR
jgi:hypothetical protein